MKKPLIRMFITLTLLLIASCVLFVVIYCKQVKGIESEQPLVILNEIEQQTRMDDGSNPAAESIAALRSELENTSVTKRQNMVVTIAGFLGAFLFIYLVFILTYLYIKIIRPFYHLEQYANQIAGGNLELSLPYEKTNFFGEFTWAFDHMREEIQTAKRREMQAIEDNKTIIASLSHDIKTPLASIRTYAEALEAQLDEDYETRQRYLAVIQEKCEEVTKLTNDLVLHSLSELDKLVMQDQEEEIAVVLTSILDSMEYSTLVVQKPLAEAKVCVDAKRLAQVMENLMNNAAKYAPNAKVTVWTEKLQEIYEIHVRDYGKGIEPADIPFLMNKFYRGKNVEEQPGSGLGLYIVQYIMKRMQGDISLRNHEDGLEVVLTLPIQSSIS